MSEVFCVPVPWLSVAFCFQSEKDLLYDLLKFELEEKIKRLEEDRHNIDITSGKTHGIDVTSSETE